MIFRWINLCIVLLCYLPYVYLITFYSFVIRAVIKLGEVPTYDNPDPKELGFDVHREMVNKTFDWVVYGLILLVILVAIVLISKKFTVKKVHRTIFFAGFIIVILHLFIDPFNVWFLD